MRRTLAIVAAMLVLASCGSAYSLDRGPLDRAECEEHAAEIVAVIRREFPERSVLSIVFVNDAGHAQVVLDDGTEVGWGERI